MHKELKKQLTFVQGIVDLFHPFVEGAIHDLESNTIAAICNNLSKRKVGAPTPLHELNIQTKEFPDYFPPYYKTNWDGKKLKCISLTIRDANGIPIGLVCFNLDVDLFQNLESKLSLLLQLQGETSSPVELFGRNWQEQIHRQIDQYLTEQAQFLHRLNKHQKKGLIEHLYKKGLFNYKNAAPFIAETLGISKASLYNYMKGV